MKEYSMNHAQDDNIAVSEKWKMIDEN